MLHPRLGFESVGCYFFARAFKIISTMTSTDIGLEMGVVMGVVGLERGVGVRLEARVPLWELVVEDREQRLEWLLGPGEAEGAGVKYIEVLAPSQQEFMNKAIVWYGGTNTTGRIFL